MKYYKLSIEDIKDIINNFERGYSNKSSIHKEIDTPDKEIKLEGYLKNKHYDKEL